MRAHRCGFICVLAVSMWTLCAAQNSTDVPMNAPPPAAGSRVIDCGAFAASDSSLSLITKLCVFALTYRSKLPDFIAQQDTTSRGGRSPVVITSQVTYRQGLEHHSQLTINGKPLDPKNPVPGDLRLFTNGEFGPLLINLFEVPNSVEFKSRGTDTVQGIPVVVFDFHLPKDKNTFWAIRDPKGETLKPEFRGRLWLQAQTGYLMREEVEPLVSAYQTGITSIKLSTDYAMIKVSDVGSFLLPVKSDSTVCLNHLGVNVGCTTNVSKFHDYQKFTATSRILSDVQQ